MEAVAMSETTDTMRSNGKDQPGWIENDEWWMINGDEWMDEWIERWMEYIESLDSRSFGCFASKEVERKKKDGYF